MGYFRRMQTTHELRENKGFVRDMQNALINGDSLYSYLKHKTRKRVNLPTYYDDIGRSDCSHRTWKRHRKTQYRSDG